MGHNPALKHSRGGKKAVFSGLARKVESALSGLTNIQGVHTGEIRQYFGSPKIKMPNRWPKNRITVQVCDAENGERDIHVLTTKPGAIQRLLMKKLQEEKLPVY